MRDEIVSGYGRGQYAARVRQVPWIVEVAAWAFVLLAVPLIVLEGLEKLASLYLVVTGRR